MLLLKKKVCRKVFGVGHQHIPSLPPHKYRFENTELSTHIVYAITLWLGLQILLSFMHYGTSICMHTCKRIKAQGWKILHIILKNVSRNLLENLMTSNYFFSWWSLNLGFFMGKTKELFAWCEVVWKITNCLQIKEWWVQLCNQWTINIRKWAW